MDDDQQFCLRWNNHQSTLISVFDTLLEKGIHVDCTLAAEGQTLKAHKVVLSACSPYFESVLSQQYDKHPIIILKDVKFAELRAMMDYMYRGEVNISQDQLGALLKAAESLQIKGLSDNKPPPPPPPAPLPLPVIPPAVSPTLKVPVVGTLSPPREEESREGSASPTRRKRKKCRASLSPTPCPLTPAAALPITTPLLLNNNPPTPPDTHHDTMAKIKLLQPSDDAHPIKTSRLDIPSPTDVATLEPKAESTEDGQEENVEDLTMDEEVDSETEHNGAGTSHSLPDMSSTQGYSWHMDRSQDDLSIGHEGQRDTTDINVIKSSVELKEMKIPIIDLDLETSFLNDMDYGEPSCLELQQSAVFSLLHNQEVSDINNKMILPQNIPTISAVLIDKTTLLEETFLQNNNFITKEEQKPEFFQKCESETEADDFDDILLPDESEVFGNASVGSDESGVRRSRGRGSGSEPPRQFECRHCGKRYRWKSTLRRHESVECGGKPPAHACPYCVYRAKQRGNLGVHIRKHHNAQWNIFANTKLRKTKKVNV